MKEKFKNLYNASSGEKRVLLSELMRKMEHNVPLKKIDISNGIKYGRIYNCDLSEKELIENLIEPYKKKMNAAEMDFDQVKSTFRSMINRNSRGSKLYDIVLERLDLTEESVQEIYFNSLSPEELFESLSPKNQEAIIWVLEEKYILPDYYFNESEENEAIGYEDLDTDLGIEIDLDGEFETNEVQQRRERWKIVVLGRRKQMFSNESSKMILKKYSRMERKKSEEKFLRESKTKKRRRLEIKKKCTSNYHRKDK